MEGEKMSVLSAHEAETYVESLHVIPMKNIGSTRWRTQHEYIEKLNMQAILNASENTDEFVPEAFVSHDKVQTAIYDLLTTELWQNKVFPLLLKMDLGPNSSLPIYMSFFHEATVLSLLETLMYHKEPCECAGETVIDLVDYCARKITQIIIRADREGTSEDNKDKSARPDRTIAEELENQCNGIGFELSLKALSILRYVSDHLECLPLSVLSRLLNTHDIPCLLVQVLDISPWKKTADCGKTKIFVDLEWKDVSHADSFKITKIEGQVWLTLYHLLMNPEAARKYEFTNYRKTQILKLRKYLNEALLDQLPILVHMQKYLHELSIMETIHAKKDLILEQVPEIRYRIEQSCGGNWLQIAEFQFREYFNPSSKQMQEQAQRLAATYNLDILESLVDEVPKCSKCGKEATKRCSRCRNQWYCSRPCQVQDWTNHKGTCILQEDLA